MAYQEKNAVISLLSTLLVFGVYFFKIFEFSQDGRFDAPDGMSFLAKAILVLIAGGIVTMIVLTILFNILYAIVTREENPSFVVDERDRSIELRGSQIGQYLFGAGFVGSMIAMAMGEPPILIFNLIMASFAFSSVGESLIRIALYRRGY